MPKLKRCVPYVMLRWLFNIWLFYNVWLGKEWAVVLCFLFVFVSLEIVARDIQVLDESIK